MADVFIRRDIWKLESEAKPWDDTTIWYAKAVAELKRRSAVDPADPTGWTYQAAMHGTYTRPGVATQRRTWNQCQHATWYFLPWHRMYLYFFEKICRSVVLAQGGPATWALPYWNYSADGDTAALPPAFRTAGAAPAGLADNPLYVAQRRTSPFDVNKGEPLPATVVAYASSIARTNFTAASAARPSFGGPTSGWAHDGPGFGALESQPHNVVHTATGGPGGLMSDPNTAALDPIFWLHHANIDRLWVYWKSLRGGRRNPTVRAWLDQAFTLFDESGTERTMTVAEVVTTMNLHYEYDDKPAVTPATVFPAAASPAPAPADSVDADPGSEPRPQLIAASAGGVRLTGAATTVGVPLDRAAVTAMSAAVAPLAADAPAAAHLYLTLQGLSAEEPPGEIYQVFLKPSADSPDAHFVGNLTFFGARPHEEPADGGEHPAGALAHTFEITEIVQLLSAAGQWDQQAVTVVLNPLGAVSQSVAALEADPTVAPHPPGNIARISIFQN